MNWPEILMAIVSLIAIVSAIYFLLKVALREEMRKIFVPQIVHENDMNWLKSAIEDIKVGIEAIRKRN